MKNKSKKPFIYISIFVLTIFISFIAGFIISHQKTEKKIISYKEELFTLQKKINKLSKNMAKCNNLIKKNEKIISSNYQKNSEIIDYLQASKNQKFQKEDTEFINKKIKTNKPKLVIIIDDVAFRYETKMIKSIPYKITPSFFPSNKIHPYTPIYAKSFKDYMVHLPMQAINYPHPEPNTMDINWSYTQIKHRIDEIKKEFPRVKFINNHTGSKFTSNLQAMNLLFLALKTDNLGFLDSKTTPYSKAKEVEKIYKIPFFQRDIFLDNKQNKNYILNQLKKAINIAKKRGYAIAIGHPHKITLETLKNAKKLLSQVDIIYIDELAKYEHN